MTEVGSQKSEVGSQKTEVGSQKSEVGSQKSEDGSQKTEDGSRKSEDGNQTLEMRSGQRTVKKAEMPPSRKLSSVIGYEFFRHGHHFAQHLSNFFDVRLKFSMFVFGDVLTRQSSRKPM